MTWLALGVLLGLIAVITLYILPIKATTLPATGPSIISQSIEKEMIIDSADDINNRPPEILWYYLDKEERQFGPMSFHALQSAWDDDQVIEGTFVWNEEMENWKTLGNLPETLEKIRRA